MKKLLLVLLIILVSSGSVFCGEFEDTLKKAEQGNADAQYNLGVIYYLGRLVTEDDDKAYYWLNEATKQNHADAQFLLGRMYNLGLGLTKDYSKSVYWCTKAAQNGHTMAQTDLGDMYYNGQGVTQNYKQAYVWWSLSAAQGEKYAIKYRDMVAKKLTPQQLSEAQELASQLYQKQNK